jgi:asparagine synthetase B (glutamine-hydrolysing)
MLAHALGKGIRFPFTDNRLAQFINQLPVALKFKGGKNKVLLRAYMAKHLPQEILTKSKAPFVFDLNRLLQNSEYRWVEDMNQQGIVRCMTHLDNEPILQLLSRYAKDPKENKWKYRLYALCLLSTFLAVGRGWNPDFSA